MICCLLEIASNKKIFILKTKLSWLVTSGVQSTIIQYLYFLALGAGLLERDIVWFGDLLLGDLERVEVAPIPNISNPLEGRLPVLGILSILAFLVEVLAASSLGSFPLIFVVPDPLANSLIGVLSRFTISFHNRKNKQP